LTNLISDNASDEFVNHLLDACTTGKIDQLLALIQESQNYNTRSVPNAEYLLETAAKSGQAKAIQVLFKNLPQCQQPRPWEPINLEDEELSNGEEFPKHWSRSPDGPIHAALEGAEPIKILQIFFDAGMSADYDLDKAGNLISVAICSLESIKLTEFLLESGASPNGQYLYQTFIAKAASQPTSELLGLLLRHGATLEGYPLRSAAEYRRIANAELLLNHGADINEVFTETDTLADPPCEVPQGTALHSAITGGWQDLPATNSSADMVRFLLNHGAKADILNVDGKTAFQLAQGQDDVLKAFSDHGIKE